MALSRLAQLEHSSRRPQPIAFFRLSLPSTEDRVRAYVPNLGHKASFLDSFPPDLADEIVITLKTIVREKSPNAARSRESDVVELPPGVSSGELTAELVKRKPWIRIKFPNNPDEDTIRKLCSAPHLGRKSAAHYKGIIPTKLALGQNNRRDFLPLVCYIVPLSQLRFFF